MYDCNMNVNPTNRGIDVVRRTYIKDRSKPLEVYLYPRAYNLKILCNNIASVDVGHFFFWPNHFIVDFRTNL